MNIYLKFVLFMLINYVASSNILGLFPHPGYSHFKVFYPILNELAQQGHNITIVSYIETKTNLSNYNEIILTGEDLVHVFKLNHFDGTRSFIAMFSEFFALHWEGKRACTTFYESNAVSTIIETHNENPFDLIILENFNTDCYYGVVELLKLPAIALSSCALMPWHYARIASPDTPSFIPSEFVGFSERMSFKERIINFIVTKGCSLLYRLTELNDNAIIKEKLNIDIDVNEIVRQRTQLIFVNQHYSLSGSRPIPRNLIEIGGVHIQENVKNDIPNDIQNFLDNSSKGIIFISWGSLIISSSMTEEQSQNMVNALEKLPYNVIWKWENDNYPSLNHKKFLFVKWAPQFELLCHPKIKIFWSHGGLLGVSESIYCAKPLVISPLYGDQFLNGRAIENREAGIIIRHEDMSEKNILKVFNEISKSLYQHNVMYVSQQYRNRENKPLNTAIWWINKVIENKNNKNLLYSPAVEFNGFTYYSLDVITILFIIPLIIFIYLISFCKKKILSVSGKIKQN